MHIWVIFHKVLHLAEASIFLSGITFEHQGIGIIRKVGSTDDLGVLQGLKLLLVRLAVRNYKKIRVKLKLTSFVIGIFSIFVVDDKVSLSE